MTANPAGAQAPKPRSEGGVPEEVEPTSAGASSSGPVLLTERAAQQIAAIMADQGRRYLRVAVNGGGCSGFSYAFDFADAPEADDVVIARDGAEVVIDEASLPFLAGSQIDFVDELIGSSFRITNPNATASCGCGTSFSV